MARAARLLAALAALLAAAAAGGDAPPSKIAVVGAGIGGSAVAHFLQQHFGPRVQIDVYEKGTVGGRLATISVNKQHYESGAAFFHSLSLHMQDFVKLLGLRHRREVVGRSAIFGGEHFVLEETDWYLLNLFRLWWHYGISFLRLQMWVEEVMEKFMRIYKYQAHGYAFSGVEELLYSLGESAFVNMTQRSVAESLLQVGVTQRFIDDVVSAVLRASYGQSAAMPAFAGAMSLAGAQGSLWSVEGGNKLVCSGLLRLTKANVIHATVTSVTLHSTAVKEENGGTEHKAPSKYGPWISQHTRISWRKEGGMFRQRCRFPSTTHHHHHPLPLSGFRHSDPVGQDRNAPWGFQGCSLY